MGVSLKIITGDNRLVAAAVSRRIGLMNPAVLTGPELHRMSGPAMLRAAEKTDIFAEIEPNQKERIVLVVRSRRPFFKSPPSPALLATTLAVVVMTLLVPLTPLAGLFGFLPPGKVARKRCTGRCGGTATGSCWDSDSSTACAPSRP